MTYRFIVGVSVVCATMLSSSAGRPHAQETSLEAFPNTSDRGRAAVEYRDEDLRVVASYYHSQLNHESKWIVIRASLSAERSMTIDREDIHLLTPGGQRIPLATQRAWSQDRGLIRLLQQNAQTVSQSTWHYFNKPDGPDFRFFASGFNTSNDRLYANKTYVLSGSLYFSSPAGAWEDGTHSLVFDVAEKGARAVLPIILQ